MGSVPPSRSPGALMSKGQEPAVLMASARRLETVLSSASLGGGEPHDAGRLEMPRPGSWDTPHVWPFQSAVAGALAAQASWQGPSVHLDVVVG